MYIIGKNDKVPDGAKLIEDKDDGTREIYFKDDERVIALHLRREASTIKEKRRASKEKRVQDVTSISVTTSAGNTFDGDECSQDRMCRAVAIMSASESIEWTLADNTVILVKKAELKEALELAFRQQSALWKLD